MGFKITNVVKRAAQGPARSVKKAAKVLTGRSTTEETLEFAARRVIDPFGTAELGLEAVGGLGSGLASELAGEQELQETAELDIAGEAQSQEDETARRRRLLLEQRRRNAPGIRQQTVLTPRSA